jgi:hypothetical protein
MATRTWKSSPTNGVLTLNTNWEENVAPEVEDSIVIVSASPNPSSGTLSCVNCTIQTGGIVSGTCDITLSGNLTNDSGGIVASASSVVFRVAGTITNNGAMRSGTYYGAAGADCTIISTGTNTLGGAIVHGEIRMRTTGSTVFALNYGMPSATKGFTYDNGGNYLFLKSADAVAGNILLGKIIDGVTGTYSPDFPAVGNVTTTDTVNGSAGTLDMSLYGLLTDYTDPGKANVVVGSDYTYAGVSQTAEHPTAATTEAAKYATDQGLVLAAAASIKDDATILGQPGTYDFAAAIAAAVSAQSVQDAQAVEDKKDSILATETILTVTGTYIPDANAYSDPGTANVLDGVTYLYAELTKRGTLIASGDPRGPLYCLQSDTGILLLEGA